MSTHCFVDADLTANMVKRHSQTGILLFCNCAPKMWYTKSWDTVESSTCGSECIVIKTEMDLIEEFDMCPIEDLKNFSLFGETRNIKMGAFPEQLTLQLFVINICQ